MKRVLILILCSLVLSSCATAPAKIDPAYNPGHSSNAEYMAANGITTEPGPPPLPMTPTPPPQPMEWDGKAGSIPLPDSPPSTGVSGWDVLGAAILFPLLLPIAMITSYPSYRGVHCQSYVYKDNYHTKCY